MLPLSSQIEPVEGVDSGSEEEDAAKGRKADNSVSKQAAAKAQQREEKLKKKAKEKVRRKKQEEVEMKRLSAMSATEQEQEKEIITQLMEFLGAHAATAEGNKRATKLLDKAGSFVAIRQGVLVPEAEFTSSCGRSTVLGSCEQRQFIGVYVFPKNAYVFPKKFSKTVKRMKPPQQERFL